MPIYEYHCSDCEKDFDALVGHSEVATECKLCGGGNIRRKLSRFSTRTDSYEASDMSSVKSGSSCAGCSSGSCATCRG
ncbi:MAG: zinc ribbon domain-containing protein [Candidatus Coatesbacteria bacterium]|nr:zinc ribbon domain-containing protein [Candidatus Coatesbacteria bacterium]